MKFTLYNYTGSSDILSRSDTIYQKKYEYKEIYSWTEMNGIQKMEQQKGLLLSIVFLVKRMTEQRVRVHQFSEVMDESPGVLWCQLILS